MKVIRFRKQSKGFTLIEVIISMAMLAIIVVPLLNYFVTSAQYNARAKTKQNATVLAQSIIEKSKDKSLEDIAKSFQTTVNGSALSNSFNLVDASQIGNLSSNVWEVGISGSTVTQIAKGSSASSYDTSSGVGEFKPGNATDGILHYAIYNISQDGNLYDAMINIDTNKDASDTYGVINGKNLVDINTLNAANNIVAIESSQNARAIEQMTSLNLAECNAENADHSGEIGYIDKIPATDTQIQAALHRQILININAVSGGTDAKATVEVIYKYYCTGILGCPNDQASAMEIDPPLYSETILANDIRNMYLFYSKNPNQEEEDLKLSITDINPSVIPNFNMYVICQALSGDVFNDASYKLKIDTLPEAYNKIKDNMYSNLSSGLYVNGVLVAPKNFITTSSSIRMEDLKVEIYKAGKINDPAYRYVTLDSSKKE